MSFRRAVMLVTRREFGERIRARAFQIWTVVTVLIVAAIAVAAGLLGGDGEQEVHGRRAGLRGGGDRRSPPAPPAKAYDIRIEVKRFTDAAQARAAAKAEDVDAAIVGDELVSQGQPGRASSSSCCSRRRATCAPPRSCGARASSDADAQRALAPPVLQARALGEQRRRGAQGRGVRRLPAALHAAHHLRPRRRIRGRRGEVLARHRGAHGRRPAARAAGRQDPRHRHARAAAACADGVRRARRRVGERRARRCAPPMPASWPSSCCGSCSATCSTRRSTRSPASSSRARRICRARARRSRWSSSRATSWRSPCSRTRLVARRHQRRSCRSPRRSSCRCASRSARRAAPRSPASLGILVAAIALLIPLGARIYEGAVLRMGKPMKMREALRAARATRVATRAFVRHVARQRSLTFFTSLAIAAGLAGAAPAATGTPPVHKLSATSHGATVHGARVHVLSHAHRSRRRWGRASAATASRRRRPGACWSIRRGSVLITVGAPVTSLSARYAGSDGASAGARVEGHPARAPAGGASRISLPASRPGALLLVSTTYRDVPTADGERDSGDAHFSIGLRRHRHAT